MANDTSKILSSASVAFVGAAVVMVFLPVIAVGAMVVGQLLAPRRKKSMVD